MSNLDISFRALRVLDTSRRLFNLYGFHHVGVNRIIESARIPKATFYKYFYSKERLIEMSLTFQKDALKEEVFALIYKKKDFTILKSLSIFSFYMPIWKVFIIYRLRLFLKLKSAIPMLIKSWLSIDIG